MTGKKRKETPHLYIASLIVIVVLLLAAVAATSPSFRSPAGEFAGLGIRKQQIEDLFGVDLPDKALTVQEFRGFLEQKAKEARKDNARQVFGS